MPYMKTRNLTHTNGECSFLSCIPSFLGLDLDDSFANSSYDGVGLLATEACPNHLPSVGDASTLAELLTVHSACQDYFSLFFNSTVSYFIVYLRPDEKS